MPTYTEGGPFIHSLRAYIDELERADWPVDRRRAIVRALALLWAAHDELTMTLPRISAGGAREVDAGAPEGAAPPLSVVRDTPVARAAAAGG